jgi:cytochrome P450
MNTADHTAPARVPADRIVEFDYINDPRLKDDPYRAMLLLREHPHSILYTPCNGGHWMVTRQDAVFAILLQPDLFSNRYVTIPPQQLLPYRLIPEELDPPEHMKYRALITPRLTPRAVASMEQATRAVARQLLEAFVARGECEFMEAFSIPMPASIFLNLLGLPVERTFEFVGWKNDLFYGTSAEVKQAAGARIVTLFEDVLADRRAEPREDWVTDILNSKIDGRPLNYEELMGVCFMLFIGGLDTVTAAMTLGFHFLATHPEHRQHLIEDPSLIRRATDELLRRHSVVNSVRTASRDFEWDGLQIRAGDQFMIGDVLANLDERAFPDPLKVDFKRNTTGHVGFGYGEHHCAGMHLARLELRTALEELLPRLPDLQLAPGARPRFHAGGLIGLDSLPLRWRAP